MKRSKKVISEDELFQEAKNGNKSALKKLWDADKSILTKINKKNQVIHFLFILDLCDLTLIEKRKCEKKKYLHPT